jgi:hypothetical protein
MLMPIYVQNISIKVRSGIENREVSTFSLTNICTFIYISPYYGRSLHIRIIWHMNVYLILLLHFN